MSKKGFTIVELLVVISVAAILATIGVVSYNNSRALARDQIRIAQLEQLQLAVELYKERYGRYPARGCSDIEPVPPWGEKCLIGGVADGCQPQYAGPSGDDGWRKTCRDYIIGDRPGRNFVPDFIDELPVDPRPRATSEDRNIYYTTNADGTAYQIMQHWNMERLRVTGPTDPYARYSGSRCSFRYGGQHANQVLESMVVYGGVPSAGELELECW